MKPFSSILPLFPARCWSSQVPMQDARSGVQSSALKSFERLCLIHFLFITLRAEGLCYSSSRCRRHRSGKCSRVRTRFMCMCVLPSQMSSYHIRKVFTSTDIRSLKCRRSSRSRIRVVCTSLQYWATLLTLLAALSLHSELTSQSSHYLSHMFILIKHQ